MVAKDSVSGLFSPAHPTLSQGPRNEVEEPRSGTAKVPATGPDQQGEVWVSPAGEAGRRLHIRFWTDPEEFVTSSRPGCGSVTTLQVLRSPSVSPDPEGGGPPLKDSLASKQYPSPEPTPVSHSSSKSTAERNPLDILEARFKVQTVVILTYREPFTYNSGLVSMPRWRNWQTRWVQDPVGVDPVGVRVPPSAL